MSRLSIFKDAARQSDVERERFMEMQRQFEVKRRELVDLESNIRAKEAELERLKYHTFSREVKYDKGFTVYNICVSFRNLLKLLRKQTVFYNKN